MSLPGNEMYAPNTFGASAKAKRPITSFLSLFLRFSDMLIVIIWLSCSTDHGYCPAVLEIVLLHNKLISALPHTSIQA